MDVLLDWLTTSGNYARWRGDSSGGITKDALCNEILGKLVDAGLRHRNKNQVRSKINDLQQTYNKARDWLSNTGQGLLDNAKEGEDVQPTIQGMRYTALELLFNDHLLRASCVLLQPRSKECASIMTSCIRSSLIVHSRDLSVSLTLTAM
jgi:hypothetical protein